MTDPITEMDLTWTSAPAPADQLVSSRIGNSIFALLVAALQMIRRLRDSQTALRDALQVATGLLAERDQEMDRLRERYHALLDERRREREIK